MDKINIFSQHIYYNFLPNLLKVYVLPLYVFHFCLTDRINIFSQYIYYNFLPINLLKVYILPLYFFHSCLTERINVFSPYIYYNFLGDEIKCDTLTLSSPNTCDGQMFCDIVVMGFLNGMDGSKRGFRNGAKTFGIIVVRKVDYSHTNKNSAKGYVALALQSP